MGVVVGVVMVVIVGVVLVVLGVLLCTKCSKKWKERRMGSFDINVSSKFITTGEATPTHNCSSPTHFCWGGGGCIVRITEHHKQESINLRGAKT